MTGVIFGLFCRLNFFAFAAIRQHSSGKIRIHFQHRAPCFAYYQRRLHAAEGLAAPGVIETNISGLDLVQWAEFMGEFPPASHGQ